MKPYKLLVARLIVAVLAVAMACAVCTLAVVSVDASCCEDWKESSYSIDSYQLAQFGYGWLGWKRAHLAPLTFTTNAMRIIECESTYRPEAVNAGGCMGLLQICPDSATRRLVQTMGYQWEDLLDPDINIDVGLQWWRATGNNWSHWECT